MNDWLSGITDEVTKQMLLGVIEKKEKLDQWKTKVKLVQIATIVGSVAFLAYVVWEILLSPRPASSKVVAFFGETNHLFFLFLLGTAIFVMGVYQKKCDKAEEEFHALRCEIIQKSADLWRTEDEWKKRHEWFTMMKTKYDINLFYENS